MPSPHGNDRRLRDVDPLPGPSDNADEVTWSDAGLTADIGAARPPAREAEDELAAEE